MVDSHLKTDTCRVRDACRAPVFCAMMAGGITRCRARILSLKRAVRAALRAAIQASISVSDHATRPEDEPVVPIFMRCGKSPRFSKRHRWVREGRNQPLSFFVRKQPICVAHWCHLWFRRHQGCPHVIPLSNRLGISEFWPLIHEQFFPTTYDGGRYALNSFCVLQAALQGLDPLLHSCPVIPWPEPVPVPRN